MSLVLFACGDSVGVVVDAEPGSADVAIDTPAGDIDISADDEGGAVVSIAVPGGEGLITAGADVPDGFPLPIAPGCEVISGSSVDTPDGRSMTVIVEMPAAEAETVTAFYLNEFEEIGLEVSQTATSGEGESAIMLTAVDESGDLSASFLVQVSGDTGDGDYRCGRLRLGRCGHSQAETSTMTALTTATVLSRGMAQRVADDDLLGGRTRTTSNASRQGRQPMLVVVRNLGPRRSSPGGE